MDQYERDLREALAARSGALNPALRERLSASLAATAPARQPMPAFAVAGMALLVVGALTGLVVSRHVLGSAPSGKHYLVVVASPSTRPTPATTASPNPVPSPDQAVVYPTGIDLSPAPGGVVWAYLPAPNLLYRSTDGGATWQQRGLAASGAALPQPPEISFVDASHGWELIPSEAGSQCGQQFALKLYRTSDAGATWQQLQPHGIDTRQCKEELSFVDTNRGFLSAYDENGRPRIFRSTDGGFTWQASPALADPPGFQSSTGGFELAAGAVRAFGSTLLVDALGRSVDETAHSYVFSSVDGGASWAYLATVPQGRAAAFVTATHWFAAGMSMETTDSGATWRASSSTYSQAAPVEPDVVFVDPNVGYAVIRTRGEIQRSADGGLHWTAVTPPGM